MNELFKVELYEDNNSNRPYIEIYNGLLDSQLFDRYETMLLIHLLAHSAAEIDTICSATMSINEISKKTRISKPTLLRRIKRLEEKGILIKQKNFSLHNGIGANTYKILNYISAWDCKTLEELKEVTDKIKKEFEIGSTNSCKTSMTT